MANQIVSTFTADTSGLQSGIDAILTKLQTMTTATTQSGEALDRHATSSKNAGEGLEKASHASEALVGHLSQISGTTNLLGEIFESVGIEAGGMAKNINFAGEAIEGLTSKAPVLIAIGAAIAVVTAGFLALKEGAIDAGQSNAALDQITNSAKNMGTSFKGAREAVEAWGDSLSESIGVDNNTLLADVQKMVAAHVDLRTAMTLTTDAQKLAIASGRDQSEVEDTLLSAVEGKTKGLVALGVITKEEAKNGISLAEVNERIQKQTQGAIEQYQNSLPGALAITGNKVTELVKSLGGDSGLAGVMVKGLQGFQEMLPAIQAFVDNGITRAREAWVALTPTINAVLPVLKSVWDSFVGILPSIEGVSERLLAVVAVIVSKLQPALMWLGTFVGKIISGVFELFKMGLDGIITVVDGFTALFTHNWSAFHHDLWVLADDGLKGLNSLFQGHLADIVAGVQSAFEYVADKGGAIAKILGSAARGDGGGVSAGVAALLGGPSIGEHFNEDKSAFTALMGNVAAQAAPAVVGAAPGKSSEIGAALSGTVKDEKIGGSTKKEKKAKQPKIGYKPPEALKALSTSALTSKIDPNAELFAQLAAGEDDLAQKVKLATNAQEQQAAIAALNKQKLADLAEQTSILATDVGIDTANRNAANVSYQAASAATNQAIAALNAYNASLKGKSTLTQAESDQQKALTAIVQNDTAERVRSKAAYEAADGELKKHQGELDKTSQAYKDLTHAAAETAASLSHNWSDFIAKSEQKMREDAQTANLTNAQKVTYYANAMAQMRNIFDASGQVLQGVTQEQLAQAEQYWTQYQTAVKGAEDDIVKAHQAAMAKMTTNVQSFLDDVITKHMSLRDALKNVFDSILKDYIAMVAKMLVENKLLNGSGGLGSIFGSIFGGGTNTTSSVDSTLKVDVAKVAGQTATSSTGVPVSAANPSSVNYNPISAYSTGSTALSGAARTTSDVGGLAAIIGGVQTGGVTGAAESGLGTVALLHGLLTGGAAAGPIGLAAGGAVALGVLISGMLGHKNNIQDNPDILASGYGQSIANLQGSGLMGNSAMNANGSSYTDTTGSATGGMGQMGYIAQYIKNNAGNAAGLTADEIKLFSNMPSVGGITGGKNGNFNFANGQTTRWDTAVSEATDALSKITAAIGTSASTITTAITQVTRLAPDFNTARTSNWGTLATGANGFQTVTQNTTSTAPATRQTQPTIHVTVHGSVVGTGGIKELAETISTTIAKNTAHNVNNSRIIMGY